ncbi:MAG: adenylate/guanylate cyclase domain-containing protein, partial [Leptospira sp.]|nr:adenylate/guanylate cyclase domain-containing protein [Leptospira sp.]
MPDESISLSRIRHSIALQFAVFFYRHLNAELTKKPELLNHITTEGVSFREITEKLILRFRNEFPEVLSMENPPYNLFERWVISRDVPPYEETTFKLYNHVFMARLVDLREGTNESRQHLQDTIIAMLNIGTFYGRGFTFSRFFKSENFMREELRFILENAPDPEGKKKLRILLEQSEFLMECGYEFFDGILKNALGESDRLLLKILPEAVTKELKTKGRSEPVHFDSATVLFTDFQGFTKVAESMLPVELIGELDKCFSYFDSLMDRYNLEKLKTIGDSYMCAGGIPVQNRTHPVDAILAALEIQSFMNQMKEIKASRNLDYWELRVGIHTGPLVAGVIGEKKFAYDIWGDTVNTASRMESSGVVGKINISGETFEKIKNFFDCEYR